MENEQKPLRLIGYWKEKSSNNRWIHPKYLVDQKWEIDKRDMIVRYLRSGVRIHEMLGYSYCRMSKSIADSKMGNAELTDGVYIWPEDLPIYLERFSVKLPDEFVQHVKKGNFQLPENLDPTELEERPVDVNFWKNWCEIHRPKGWRKLF